jgi:DNA repair protein RadD
VPHERPGPAALPARVIDDFDRAVAAGQRHIMLVAPTGSGKTIIAGDVINSFGRKMKPVMVLAHRREIIAQTSQKLHQVGVSQGIIQAGFPTRPLELVQVASVQTLWTRAYHTGSMDLPPADLLVIDEAHHCPANTYRKIIDAYPEAIVLGLTATPCRGDGRGLGGIFDVIVECPQVAELIEQHYLVKTRVYAPVNPDLRGVETRVGDYVESQLAERMDRPDLLGDIVTHWHKFGERRKTVCFAVSVNHSKVACCILARPTKKMGLYRQMIGRILRPAPGKTDASVLDHSGAVFRHGFVEDRVEWTLDPDRRAESPVHKARCEHHSSRLLECTQCGAVRIAGEPCSHCGFLPQRPPQSIVFKDGDLALVDRKNRTTATAFDPHERMRWHAMLAHIAADRGYKPGWVAYKYKEKFGGWPASRDVTPIEPSREVLSWVRSRNIAWAKAQQKATNAA